MQLQTPRLTLQLQTVAEVRAMIAGLPPELRAEVSDEWLDRLERLTSDDFWTLSFSLIHRGTEEAVGTCGFKGPPDAERVVEIAYGIAPEHQGQGYATEAAAALTAFAFHSGAVDVVRAHTLPQSNASTRVLTKCGFHHVGGVVDPDDGPVWRWETRLPEPSQVR